MKNIRLMSVTFDTPIKPYEISAFRGAVIEKVGLDKDLYHNHDNNPNSNLHYHYRYPLVQYKLRYNKPNLIFIEEGIEEAQHFFTQPDWNLHFANRQYKATIEKFEVKQYNFGMAEDWQIYSVRRWMALNQENYKKYLKLEGLVDRISFLERILTAHLVAMAKGLNLRFEGKIHLSILKILDEKYIPYGDRVKVKVFDLRFKANLNLPFLLGIGKGTSLGFGTLNGQYKNQNRTSFAL